MVDIHGGNVALGPVWVDGPASVMRMSRAEYEQGRRLWRQSFSTFYRHPSWEAFTPLLAVRYWYVRRTSNAGVDELSLRLQVRRERAGVRVR